MGELRPSDPRVRSALGSAETLAGGAPTVPAAPGDPLATPPGTLFGRFVVLEPLGIGGMGVVMAAYDPDLDRRVALKLLRTGRDAGAPERLLREARAMARLSHPNVLAVHEVGKVGEQLFLTMEFAEGGTLREWCRGRPRAEIVEAFLAAGRGLAAAHEAGLVHRDFKPENVLIMRDGTVKVADFGLAIGAATAEGSVQGTPSYMPPEQLRGLPVGAGADQFAFCVALWEALCGARPFAGVTPEELVGRIEAGRLVPAAAGAEPPGWMLELLRRGLRAVPAERWPSMKELLAALADDPVQRRRRRLRGAAVALAVAAVAGAAAFGLGARLGGRGEPAAEPCAAAGDRLDEVWNPARRDRVSSAFAAAAGERGRELHARVAGRIDDHAARWTAARHAACVDTHVRHVQSPAALDLRMRCLDRRLAELGALIDLLAERMDAGLADKAIEASARLSGLAECADTEALAQTVPLPDDPGLRERIAAARGRLARARALEQAGRYADGLAELAGIDGEVDALDHAPLRAETLLQRGRLHKAAGDAAAAESALMAGLYQAAAARDDVMTTALWGELLYVIGYQQRRHERARELRPIAEAAARRAGGDGEAGASVYNSLGATLVVAGRYAEALEQLHRAVTIRERVLGPEHPDVARGLNNLGTALEALGRYDEAWQYYQRALALKERVMGPTHPSVASGLNNLGVVLTKWGRLEEAERTLERSLAIWEQALGPEHADVANALNNLGAVLAARGRPADALARYQRALGIRERALGADHPHVALTLTGIARAQADLGDPDAAIAAGERALAIRLARPGDPALLAEARFALAVALWAGGRDRARARSLAEQARSGFADAGPARTRELADAERWLAARR